MKPQPVIDGVVARSCHPYGCRAVLARQIASVRAAVPIEHGPRRVLILGASSGFGLAARVALTFGGAAADSIGVSFERGPSEKGIGSAGWYNNIFLREAAEQAGRMAVNVIGDAFSPGVREQVTELIRCRLGGPLDMLIYSLASGMRPDYQGGPPWRSVIKPIGAPASGYSLDLQHGELLPVTLEPASAAEIEATIKVMGGEDWQQWIDSLHRQGLLAPGFRTLAFSYIGPPSTHALYHHGTLGRAKAHLHQSAGLLRRRLAPLQGDARVVVCKALVTKASMVIPGMAPYLLALYRVMRQQGLHEECIEQMQRLFSDKLANVLPELDGEGLIRLDDWELIPAVQQQVDRLLAEITPDNFRTLGDFDAILQVFLQQNGFVLEEVDYQADIDPQDLARLSP